MNWYHITLTKSGAIIHTGWKLANTPKKLIDDARHMGYSIDIRYIGPADLQAAIPKIRILH